MNDVIKIAVGVFMAISFHGCLEAAVFDLAEVKPPIIRVAEAVEKIAAECAVVAREKEGGR